MKHPPDPLKHGCQLLPREEDPTFLQPIVDWNNVGGIATCYALDVPGIETRCGRAIPHPSREALRSNQPRAQWVPSPLPKGKAAAA